MHLAFASFIGMVVGLAYGINPTRIMSFFFDFNVESVDLSHLLRAIMGLYLALGVYWIMGIFKSEHWRGATITCTIFMGGLAVGRMISLIIDGIPSITFSIGMIVEIVFMVWGIFNLKKETHDLN
ncbi:MAG: DUF4345 domain-containing protein [Saprospiraceae bacterium]|nr:DUF4345 domain-containing protein [Saprospiraceae bacterium]